MKRVSFEIAKALRDAGYPQDNVPITEIGWYNIARVYTNQLPTYWEGDNMFVAVAPTYLEAWLWLWREKNIIITVSSRFDSIYGYRFVCIMQVDNSHNYYTEEDDPEEAIAAAIKHLVDNKLLK